MSCPSSLRRGRSSDVRRLYLPLTSRPPLTPGWLSSTLAVFRARSSASRAAIWPAATSWTRGRDEDDADDEVLAGGAGPHSEGPLGPELANNDVVNSWSDAHDGAHAEVGDEGGLRPGDLLLGSAVRLANGRLIAAGLKSPPEEEAAEAEGVEESAEELGFGRRLRGRVLDASPSPGPMPEDENMVGSGRVVSDRARELRRGRHRGRLRRPC